MNWEAFPNFNKIYYWDFLLGLIYQEQLDSGEGCIKRAAAAAVPRVIGHVRVIECVEAEPAVHLWALPVQVTTCCYIIIKIPTWAFDQDPLHKSIQNALHVHRWAFKTPRTVSKVHVVCIQTTFSKYKQFTLTITNSDNVHNAQYMCKWAFDQDPLHKSIQNALHVHRWAFKTPRTVSKVHVVCTSNSP
jgi:hypothetical protein